MTSIIYLYISHLKKKEYGEINSFTILLIEMFKLKTTCIIDSNSVVKERDREKERERERKT